MIKYHFITNLLYVHDNQNQSERQWQWCADTTWTTSPSDATPGRATRRSHNGPCGCTDPFGTLHLGPPRTVDTRPIIPTNLLLPSTTRSRLLAVVAPVGWLPNRGQRWPMFRHTTCSMTIVGTRRETTGPRPSAICNLWLELYFTRMVICDFIQIGMGFKFQHKLWFCPLFFFGFCFCCWYDKENIYIMVGYGFNFGCCRYVAFNLWLLKMVNCWWTWYNIVCPESWNNFCLDYTWSYFLWWAGL